MAQSGGNSYHYHETGAFSFSARIDLGGAGDWYSRGRPNNASISTGGAVPLPAHTASATSAGQHELFFRPEDAYLADPASAHLRGTIQDITAETAARRELAKTAKLLETVFENMAEGISVADANPQAMFAGTCGAETPFSLAAWLSSRPWPPSAGRFFPGRR